MRIKVPSLLRALEGTTISLDQLMPTAHTSTTFSFLSQLLPSSTSSLLYTCSPALENRTAPWCWGTQGHLYPVYHLSASNLPFFALLCHTGARPCKHFPLACGWHVTLGQERALQGLHKARAAGSHFHSWLWSSTVISIHLGSPATRQVSSSCVFRPRSPISSCV